MKLVEQTLEAQQLVPEDLAPNQQRHLCLDKGYDYDEVREILHYIPLFRGFRIGSQLDFIHQAA